ncbi:MAG: competence type IV pilus minor pilin ComGF [Bacilli bacterium]|jgi:competence protein ComGF|uniref:Competence type IV pilus minor pilin ComGF n=1 Tax=Ureibacillus suwonensis TaxID=313007 RepID=A0ABW0R653_9BACL|nr:hypothetical protein [Bacilli bacterium]
MHRCQWRVRNNRNGFTLIEALFHLLTFTLLAQLILAIYLLIQQWNDTFLADEQIKWEIFIQDFQQYLIDIEDVYWMANSLYIVESPSKTLKINKISDVIRLQVNGQGYVPLLIGIQNAEFVISDNLLTVKVRFLNGIEKERTLFVQYKK